MRESVLFLDTKGDLLDQVVLIVRRWLQSAQQAVREV